MKVFVECMFLNYNRAADDMIIPQKVEILIKIPSQKA
jgi:hypothetical protein